MLGRPLMLVLLLVRDLELECGIEGDLGPRHEAVWARLGGAPCEGGAGSGGCAGVTLGAVPTPADPASLRAIEGDAVLKAAVGPAGEFQPLHLNETLVDPMTNGTVLTAGLSGSADAAARPRGETLWPGHAAYSASPHSR